MCWQLQTNFQWAFAVSRLPSSGGQVKNFRKVDQAFNTLHCYFICNLNNIQYDPIINPPAVLTLLYNYPYFSSICDHLRFGLHIILNLGHYNISKFKPSYVSDKDTVTIGDCCWVMSLQNFKMTLFCVFSFMLLMQPEYIIFSNFPARNPWSVTRFPLGLTRHSIWLVPSTLRCVEFLSSYHLSV